MRKMLIGLAALTSLLIPQAHAADEVDVKAAITEKLAPLRVVPETVKPSVIPGLYEVVDGGRVLYSTADGKYVFSGSLYDTDTLENLSDGALNGKRKAVVDRFDESTMVVFAPKGETKHTVTIFTDIDCGYCRKLHDEIEAYNELGIKVRYMAYPRAGIGSASYEKYVNVWCAEDSLEAMTVAKGGGTVPKKSCKNPVADQFAASQELGLSGTPSIILEDGTLIPGYKPADALLADINK